MLIRVVRERNGAERKHAFLRPMRKQTGCFSSNEQIRGKINKSTKYNSYSDTREIYRNARCLQHFRRQVLCAGKVKTRVYIVQLTNSSLGKKKKKEKRKNRKGNEKDKMPC